MAKAARVTIGRRGARRACDAGLGLGVHSPNEVHPINGATADDRGF